MSGEHLTMRRARRWAGLLPLLAVAAAAAACNNTRDVMSSRDVGPGRPLFNTPVTGAAFTTVNETVDGTGHCLNGNPAVNCNIYDGKDFVWLNGGPSTAYVGDGSYFFAVLSPGGQADPNDGAAKNLSDDFDVYTNRTFSVSGGTVSYLGSHLFDSNKIRLSPYADTDNPGGVYLMAICSLADGYPVTPSKCRYDAFKIRTSGGGGGESEAPVITKDATATYDNKYGWTITKDVDKTLVKQVGGTVTFNYTVKVTHDGGTISNVKVTGKITVSNFNVDNITAADVTDKLSNGTDCTVTGGSSATLGPGDNDFDYSCDLGSSLPSGTLANTATVTWSTQTLSTGELAGGSADFKFSNISFTGNSIDECVNVTDSFGGSLGTACFGDANPKTFTYSRTITVPQFGCKSYDNTATFTATDDAATGSASQTVTVCGPAKTGALTMGFWQNRNGQGIINSYCAGTSGTSLYTYLTGFNPFKDLASSSCANVATYVYSIIKAANASGAAMNAMLKAQMLATALDVYFSSSALGGNKINAPAPIGGVAIDLTKICKIIDGSGGTGTCSSTYQNVSSAFGGATSLTVSQMLAYAASQSTSGGSTWYGNVKATQELAKNAFDAINNQLAFAA